MRKDKQEALNLRKQGKSYREIKDKLGVPKSTLSGWLKGQNWSRELAVDLAEQAEKQILLE